jgi:hypothetical protein
VGVYSHATGAQARIAVVVVGCALVVAGCYGSGEDATVHERRAVESAFLGAGIPLREAREGESRCQGAPPVLSDEPLAGGCFSVTLEQPDEAPAPIVTLTPRRREPFSVSIYRTAADAERALDAAPHEGLLGDAWEYARSGNVVATVVRRDRALLDDVEAVLDDL